MNLENQKRQKNKLLIVFLAVYIVCIVAFVFSNSITGSEASASKSRVVAEKLQTIVDTDNKIITANFHRIVRKIAHIAEFALLGTGLGGLFYAIYLSSGKKYVSVFLLVGLFVGLFDELIQEFNSRKSLASDVLIDFGGIVIGFFAVLLAIFLINKIKKRRQ